MLPNFFMDLEEPGEVQDFWNHETPWKRRSNTPGIHHPQIHSQIFCSRPVVTTSECIWILISSFTYYCTHYYWQALHSVYYSNCFLCIHYYLFMWIVLLLTTCRQVLLQMYLCSSYTRASGGQPPSPLSNTHQQKRVSHSRTHQQIWPIFTQSVPQPYRSFTTKLQSIWSNLLQLTAGKKLVVRDPEKSHFGSTAEV